ncbi:hypothetical protein FRC00_010479 [Tulasnella sp. 408]|nr:hypothetical protein FRC00_010479 [Tulasnella sp. 408]
MSKPDILRDMEASSTRDAIEFFLRDHLDDIARKHNLASPWPTHDELMALVEKSGLFFIYAATAVRFIQNGSLGSPQTRLQLLLSDDPKSTSQFKDVDARYTQVLRDGFFQIIQEEDDAEETQIRIRRAFRDALAAIVLMQEPLALSSLETFLPIDRKTLHQIFTHLSSVIHFQDDAKEHVYVLHPSFRDFLTDPQRCREPRFYINPPDGHVKLAVACFKHMSPTLDSKVIFRSASEAQTALQALRDPDAQHIRYSLRSIAYHISHCPSNDRKSADIVMSLCGIVGNDRWVVSNNV